MATLVPMTTPAGGALLNVKRLDVAALAAAGQSLDGEIALSTMQRLSEQEWPHPAQEPVQASQGVETPLPSAVRWSVRGHLRPVKGGDPQTLLHLRAQAQVMRTCQRCLQPVELTLQVDRHFLFAPNEALAEAWDAESEEDVLALSRSLDLPELIEDELLLELPLVPRHENCRHAALSGVGAAPAEAGSGSIDPEPHPFAALAALRGKLKS